MRVGQRVKCIDDAFSEQFRITVRKLPKAGRAYTVRKVLLGYEDGTHDSATVAILLDGLFNRKTQDGVEPAFLTTRFETVGDAHEMPYDR